MEIDLFTLVTPTLLSAMAAGRVKLAIRIQLGSYIRGVFYSRRFAELLRAVAIL